MMSTSTSTASTHSTVRHDFAANVPPSASSASVMIPIASESEMVAIPTGGLKQIPPRLAWKPASASRTGRSSVAMNCCS